MYIEYCKTSFGIFKITATEDALLSVTVAKKVGPKKPNKLTVKISNELTAFSKGKLMRFSNYGIPSGTGFQQDVWRAIAGIPYGTTKSYKEIAVAIGRPAAVRAVGTATGKNPFCIIIPCHRIVKSNGETGHYAFGPRMKEHLLNLEIQTK